MTGTNRRRRRSKSRHIPNVSRRVEHGLCVVVVILANLFYLSPRIVNDAHRPSDEIAYDALSKQVRDWTSERGEVAQWAPSIFCGMPSYGSMIYSPGEPINHYLFWISGGNDGVRFWIVLSIGGIALYFFLRRQRLDAIPALLGTLVFTCTPYFSGLLGAGHYNKIWAAGYIPLILLACDCMWANRTILGFVATTTAIVLQLWVNHPQVTYYTLMLVGVWWISRFVTAVRAGRIFRNGVIEALLFAAALLWALAIVALPYLPVLEYSKHSVRGAPSVLTREPTK